MGEDIAPETLLVQAREEFRKNNKIPSLLLDQIKREKSSVLPSVKEGLDPAGSTVTSSQGSAEMSEFRQWVFWLEMARAVKNMPMSRNLPGL